MMHGSMLKREELQIFEELISRFDSLSEAQMRRCRRDAGMVPRKICWAHLAYGERGRGLNRFREFEAGKWRARKRTAAPR